MNFCREKRLQIVITELFRLRKSEKIITQLEKLANWKHQHGRNLTATDKKENVNSFPGNSLTTFQQVYQWKVCSNARTLHENTSQVKSLNEVTWNFKIFNKNFDAIFNVYNKTKDHARFSSNNFPSTWNANSSRHTLSKSFLPLEVFLNEEKIFTTFFLTLNF